MVSCLLLVAAQSVAFAGSGMAIVPYCEAYQRDFETYSSTLFITNISQHDLKVEVSVYDNQGNEISSGISYRNFESANTEISAGKMGEVEIGTVSGDQVQGYAVIEWTNKAQENDYVGLVASGTSPRVTPVVINGGAPF